MDGFERSKSNGVTIRTMWLLFLEELAISIYMMLGVFTLLFLFSFALRGTMTMAGSMNGSWDGMEIVVLYVS